MTRVGEAVHCVSQLDQNHESLAAKDNTVRRDGQLVQDLAIRGQRRRKLGVRTPSCPFDVFLEFSGHSSGRGHLRTRDGLWNSCADDRVEVSIGKLYRVFLF